MEIKNRSLFLWGSDLYGYDLEVSGYSALKRAACDAMSSASLK